MSNYEVIEAGSMSDWKNNKIPFGDITFEGKRFLRNDLGATGCEISINSFLPGKETMFLHRHKLNEEIYIFLSGHGEFVVDSEVIKIKPGTVVKVKPSGVRGYKNTGDDELHYICVQVEADSLTKCNSDDGEIVE